jgi:Tfp pilus assembly protein FimT
MSPPRRHLLPSRQDRGFTIAEAMVYAALMMTLTAFGFHSMRTFSEEQKLRIAAVELSAYLEVARSVALTDNAPCVIAMSNSSQGIFGVDTSGSTNACQAGKINTSLDLRELTGSTSLSVALLPGSGTYPLTFHPEGTTRSGATVLISSRDVTSGSWCVDVQAPLATVRRGWRATGSITCNYGVEQ